ncbi:DUF1737 domain-containing protein [Micromonospora sp. NPDC048909]|uniref:DUF1737 domain-containing protein n=1 Tax=Micromonospora sp. NPDC048909 TaxID=3155643 RepID=UPI0033E4B8CB
MTSAPPNGLPRYRLLTGPDDESFCRRVSEMLDLGYRLHGDPAITYNGERVIAAQALVWAQAEHAPQPDRSASRADEG